MYIPAQQMTESLIKIYGRNTKGKNRLSIDPARISTLTQSGKQFLLIKRLFVDGIINPLIEILEDKKKLVRLSQDECKIRNRVRLLKAEEEKMLKKINETKTRAEKIFEIKERNEQKLIERMRYKQD